MSSCYCNAANRRKCCVTECKDQHSGENGCYPCNCWRGRERCLHSGQLKTDMGKEPPVKRFAAPPSGICIHHSATKDGALNDTAAIRRYHKETNGWDDIGYHGVIERIDGKPRFVSGRLMEFQGAHEPDLNATHLGLCIVGNFDIAAPDSDLLDEAARVCSIWMERYSIPLTGVVYHCDYSPKSCPGRQFPKAGFLLALAGEERP